MASATFFIFKSFWSVLKKRVKFYIVDLLSNFFSIFFRVAAKKMDASMLAHMYPEGSGNMRLENFVPAWYLLENHRNAR
jgi:hypothetical protein